MPTGIGADFAMFVHIGVTLTLRGAGTGERDTGGELRFQELPVADLVGPRQDAPGRGANRRTILVKTDAGDQPLNVSFGEASIRACGTGLDAGETSLDTAAQCIGMGRLLRVPAKHRSHGNGGHGFLPF